jgi:aminopeptidase YwaD
MKGFSFIKTNQLIKRVLLILFLTFAIQGHGQDSLYVRSLIDSLSSPRYFGRGYVNEGDKKAANFIANEFKKTSAKPIGNSYLQPVPFPINTFPKQMEVTLDDSLLIPFYDYKVSASSVGGKGTYEVVEIPVKALKSEKRLQKFIDKTNICDKFILINESSISSKKQKSKSWAFAMEIIHALPYQDILPVRGIIIVKEKIDAQGMWSKDPLKSTVIRIVKSKVGKHPKKIMLNIDQQFYPKYTSNNVVAYIKGTAVPDTFVVFGGHYDHLGCLGEKTFFPGANDNASGIATVIDLARYYSQPDHQPYYSMAFIAFTGEEAGLLGSKFYTENPLFPLSTIKYMFNLDMVGTCENGITVVNATANPKIYQQLDTLNKLNKFLPSVTSRGEAANSDHHSFHKAGVPAVFIYGAGKSGPYHHPEDNSENLGLKGYLPMFNLLTKFVNTTR